MIVAEWVGELTGTHLFGPDDPLFPATRIAVGEDGRFAPRRAGATALVERRPDPARVPRGLRTGGACPTSTLTACGKTLARLGEQACPTPEAFKAWSQNLGHEQVLTTFTSYGAVAPHRQAEIMAGLREGARPGSAAGSAPNAATIAAVVRHLANVAGKAQ